MRLEFHDHDIKNPTDADLARAIPDGPPPEDWWMALERDNGDSLDADEDGEGRYAPSFVEGGKYHVSTGPSLTPAEMRAMATLYMRNDPAWRARSTWKLFEADHTVTAQAKSLLDWSMAPLLIPIAVILVIVANILGYSPIQYLPGLSWPFPPPFDSTAARVIICIFGGIGLLVLGAAVAKFVEVRRARRWPSAHGRITRSESGFQTGDSDSAPEGKLVARIAYEFTANGRTYAGTRVDLGENTSPDYVPAILARYPVGKLVEVFYDPKDPQKAVLERGVPGFVASGLIAFIGILGFFAGVALIFAFTGFDLVYDAFPRSTPIVMLPAAFVAFILFSIFLSFWRKHRAAASWPTTIGQILISDVRIVRSGDARAHAPLVEYGYRVAGKDYKSRQIRAGTSAAGSESYARGVIANWPQGAQVNVRYNPKNPFEAALETRMGKTWLLALFGGVAALIALLASGVL